MRKSCIEFSVVLLACIVCSVAFVAPWHPNAETIPTTYQGDGEFFARLDAGMWTYMLGWGARHPGRFYDAPVLLPVRNPLAANDPRLTEGLWSIPLFRFFPPVTAWGLSLLCALALTAVGTYYAGKLLSGSRWGGAAMAVLFAFGLFRANHVCHIEGTFAPFLALAPVAMWRFLNFPDRRHGVFFAVILAAAMVEYSYLAVALSLTVSAVMLWQIGSRRLSFRRGVTPLVSAFLLTALVMLPVAFVYFGFHKATGVERVLVRVDYFSAHLRSWLTGPTGQVLPPLGGTGEDIPDLHLFPGWVTLLLGLAGWRLLYRKSPAIAWIGLLSFLLSFGTMRYIFWESGVPHFGGLTPYELLYKLFLPIKAIRAPARLGVLAHVVLAFAACLAVVRLTRLPRGKFYAAVFLAIAFIEARRGMHDVLIRPARMDDSAYRWIAEQPDRSGVMEGAMGLIDDRWQHLAEAESMLVSLVHGRPTPNGTMAASLRWHDSIAANTSDPSHPETLRVLRALGVRYVVANRGSWAGGTAARGYTPVYVSERGTRVYEVASPLSVPRSREELATRLDDDPFYGISRSAEGKRAGRIFAPAHVTVRKARGFELPLVVENTGETIWPARSYIYGRTETGDVTVGIRCWRRVKNDERARGIRGDILGAVAFLPTNLRPAERAQVVLTGVTPRKSGEYIADLDFLVVGKGWTSPPDKPVVQIHIRVE